MITSFGMPSACGSIIMIRIYIWIEGQDIDSLETDSEGADISVSLSLTKDTVGYTDFND